MKRILLLFLISFLFFSCFHEKVRIRPEKRVAITGRVVDGEDRGLPGIPVVSSGALGGYVSGSPYQILGLSRTTASGYINFVSLDTYNSDLSVSINPENEKYYNEDFASLHFVDQEDDHGTFLTLDNVILPKKIDFNFSILNTSGAQGEISFSITFSQQELYYQIINRNITGEAPENYNFRNYQTLRGTHNLNSGNLSEVIRTLEGTELIFTYTLPGEEESREIIIPVTPQTNNYVFEY